MLMQDETALLKPDDSIQTHSATSRLREVEVLRDALETLLNAHAQKGDPIMPREILIASPNIALYAPYIQMIFAQSALPFAIQGIPISATCQKVQGFLQLLKLKEEGFTFFEVIKLLQCAPFMDKNGFVPDEIHSLCKWLKHAEIQEKLSGHSNSWEAGIDRLLYGLTLIPDERAEECPNQPEIWNLSASKPQDSQIGELSRSPNSDWGIECWPLACIPQSEIDIFNRFLELFEKIKNDLDLLSGKKVQANGWKFFCKWQTTIFI